MDIDGWLRKIGLDQYVEKFRESGIDLSVLPDLTDQDLEKLGVLLGHRRKMMRAIADLGATGSDTSTTAAVPPRPPHARDAAERRQLTIMFCDLVGSTALSTRLDPEDMREVVGAYHRCCADLIVGVGGFVARYMGDGVLAYFGYPQAHEHDAERAVRAGLSLVHAVPKLETAAGDPLQVRIGIATGLVVVGDLIRTDLYEERGVVGETPNLASRLQTLAEPGTVVISDSTHRLTGGLFDYRDLGPVPLKGFAQTVPAWQVLGVSSAESRFLALRASTTPLVGRDEEVGLLRHRWEQAKGGAGSVVLLSGEPGIGKSRIAETLLQHVHAEPHIRLRQFCSPHHQDSALHPVITQLERTAKLRRKDTDSERLAKLEALLALSTADLGEAVPVLAALLSIPTGDSYPALDLTPQRRKEKTLRALAAQVQGLAARQPVLLVIEDAHWADPTSLELFELAARDAAHLPMLAIFTCRPEFQPAWGAGPQVTRIDLDRLPRHHCAEIAAHVAGGRSLPQEIADQITERTDGVPLFIEELTKTVIESGLLTEAGDRYVATAPIAPLAIPTSLQESLLARLDRLTPTNEVAQIAAALGRHFSHELISAVAGLPQQELDHALAQLVDAELIFRHGTPPDADYMFKHALVQDTAYGKLVRSRRQQIHARITTALEQQFPDMVTAQPALLARHAMEAGLSAKAVAYSLAAGRQSLARSASIEAAAQLRKGLEALKGLPDGPERGQQELDLQLASGLALMAVKGYSAPEVGETLVRARTLAEQSNRPGHLWPVMLGQTSYHRVRGEHRQALALAEEMEQLGKARNDVAAQLIGRWANGRSRLFIGDFLSARALLESCQGLVDPAHRSGVSSADPYAMMLAYLAWTLSILGYVDQARARLNDALSEARRRNQAHTLADALLCASAVEAVIGSPRMREHADELLALATDRALPLNLGWANVYRGTSMAVSGQGQEGLSLIEQGATTIRATGAVTGSPNLLMVLAEAHAGLGRPLEGLTHLEQASQIMEATDERYSEAEMHRLRGDFLHASGDVSAAEGSYHHALAVARAQSARLFELRTSIRLARLWDKDGRRAEARDLLAPIHGWFSEGFDAPDLTESAALLRELS